MGNMSTSLPVLEALRVCGWPRKRVATWLKMGLNHSSELLNTATCRTLRRGCAGALGSLGAGNAVLGMRKYRNRSGMAAMESCAMNWCKRARRCCMFVAGAGRSTTLALHWA